MSHRALILLGSTILVSGVAGCACPREGEETVCLDRTPAAVRDAIRKHAEGGEVEEIERSLRDGVVVYEVEVEGPGGGFEFAVAADGTYLGLEPDEGEEDDEEWHDDDDTEAAGDSAGAFVVPTPLRDGVRFSAKITNPYFPLSAVRVAVLEGDGERVVREVQEGARRVAGVECLVLAENEFEGGVLKEISYNFFAQDEDGNVYYFGEEVDEYENGRVVGHSGAWLVGRNAAEPCLIMPARPVVGFRFKPENSPPVAEEWDEVADLDASLRVPAGRYDGVLVIKESDRPGRWKERKYYARGVGLISEDGSLNLVSMSAPGVR